MKNIKTTIIVLLAASLILLSGCYDGGSPMPPVLGYTGLVNAGWASFKAGDYKKAMDNFEAAMEMDCSRPEAFLGAGWASILLPDYWGVAYQYDYMAVQHDGKAWPVANKSATLIQNLDWSVFECVNPVLTADDRTVINSFGRTDSLVIGTYVVFAPTTAKPAMDNLEIGKWLHRQYGAIRFQYKFKIADPDVNAMFMVNNGCSFTDCPVDSIVNGSDSSTVYISVPQVREPAAGVRTWCMNENEMAFKYATYRNLGGQTAFAEDAVAAYGTLQNIKGENGDELAGVAALLGLAADDQYSFSHYAGITSLKMKGMAAAMAFANSHFRPALSICRRAGYGLNIKVTDKNFLIELMQAIDSMLQ
jgi:hypothetical protein